MSSLLHSFLYRIYGQLLPETMPALKTIDTPGFYYPDGDRWSARSSIVGASCPKRATVRIV